MPSFVLVLVRQQSIGQISGLTSCNKRRKADHMILSSTVMITFILRSSPLRHQALSALTSVLCRSAGMTAAMQNLNLWTFQPIRW